MGEFDEETNQFRREAQGDGDYTVTIVPGHQIGAEIERANQGDKNAQYTMLCFLDWQKKTETLTPHCFRCGKELVAIYRGGEGIGGFAVVRPTDPNSEIAINGAFCLKCAALGYQAISAALRTMLAHEYECGVEDIPIQ